MLAGTLGIIPYGAQMLIAVSTAASLGVSVAAFDILPYFFYPYMLAVCAVLYIILSSRRSKA